MEQLREPRFYPNEQDLDVLAKTKSTIKITVDSEGLDEAIEKTNRLLPDRRRRIWAFEGSPTDCRFPFKQRRIRNLIFLQHTGWLLH